MECVELAPAFEPRHTSDSGSKLHALHTLRETTALVIPLCNLLRIPRKSGQKDKIFAYIIQRAGVGPGVCRGALNNIDKSLSFHGAAELLRFAKREVSRGHEDKLERPLV